MYTKQEFLGVSALAAVIFGLVISLSFAALPALAQTADDYGTADSSNYCPKLSITMQRGARDVAYSGQVSELQKFISDYYDIDPDEIVTGFFGRITQGYVQQFQREQGLPTFGIAGSMTRAAIAKVCTSNTFSGTGQTNPNTTPTTPYVPPTTTYVPPTNTQTTNTAPNVSSAATTIQVTYPQAGNVLENTGAKSSGLIANIQWSEQNGDYPVNIWLLNSSGQITKGIAYSAPDTGSYGWAYDPSLPSGTYGIQIDVLYPSGKGGQARAYSGFFTIAPIPASSITATYPNGGEQIAAGLGKDVDFRITWTSSNLSGNAYVYLTASDGTDCLLGSAPVSQGNFAVLYNHYSCQNTSSILASGQYRVHIETDTLLSSGKSVNSQGNGYFTLTVTQPPPSISYISPTMSTGKDVDRVGIYGSNFLLTGKGGPVYVDLLQNGSIKQRLSPTDSPMTIFAGSYLTPPDSSGTRMEVRINNANLGPGTYQLRVTTDSGASNTADYTVQ